MASASDTGLLAEWPYPRGDLEHALATAPIDWSNVRGARVLLTGGTGFVGSWLLSALLWADAERELGVRVSLLTRDPARFARRLPSLAHDPRVTLLAGDVKTFTMSDTHDLLIHAAAHAPQGPSAADQSARGQADVLATRNALKVAAACGARRILFTSSGAVYGTQPLDVDRVAEDAYAPEADAAPATSAYGEAKRVSEALLQDHAAHTGTVCLIARCFTFLGPGLPLDAGYAAGDFLGDALRGRPIHVAGDGSPLRSYLHTADLAAWLLTILMRGRSCVPYNVGSDSAVSVGSLAARVAALVDPPLPVVFGESPDHRPASAPARYVPSVERARKELGLRDRIGLDDALFRTWQWLRARGR